MFTYKINVGFYYFILFLQKGERVNEPYAYNTKALWNSILAFWENIQIKDKRVASMVRVAALL